MKIFYSECPVAYTSYTFPYAIYALPEGKGDLEEIYSRGFLPYTGRQDITTPCFYLARSLRIDLNQSSETSENRRVMRKMEDLDLQFRTVSMEEFQRDRHFVKLCTDYARKRFKKGGMDAERLEYVLGLGLATEMTICEMPGRDKPVAYIILCRHGKGLHYWYSFYDTEVLEKGPVGKMLMWHEICRANSAGLAYCYLGTCYGKHSLYKVRDHKGAEFFDGSAWNGDLSALKRLCKSDEEREMPDFFKEMETPQDYIDKL